MHAQNDRRWRFPLRMTNKPYQTSRVGLRSARYTYRMIWEGAAKFDDQRSRCVQVVAHIFAASPFSTFDSRPSTASGGRRISNPFG
jgi:hypothetical protein